MPLLPSLPTEFLWARKAHRSTNDFSLSDLPAPYRSRVLATCRSVKRPAGWRSSFCTYRLLREVVSLILPCFFCPERSMSFPCGQHDATPWIFFLLQRASLGSDRRRLQWHWTHRHVIIAHYPGKRGPTPQANIPTKASSTSQA